MRFSNDPKLERLYNTLNVIKDSTPQTIGDLAEDYAAVEVLGLKISELEECPTDLEVAKEVLRDCDLTDADREILEYWRDIMQAEEDDEEDELARIALCITLDELEDYSI